MIAAINEAVDITVTKNARGGMDIVDTVGRTLVFGGNFDANNNGLNNLTNRGHVALSSVDGKSDISSGVQFYYGGRWSSAKSEHS